MTIKFDKCFAGIVWLLCIGSLLTIPGAWAQSVVAQPSQYNVFRLASSATLEVDNDLMLASLYIEAQDKDPAVLAQKINSTMTWATNILRPLIGIAVKTRDYQTYPRYENYQSRRLIGWTARQSIELETDNFTAAGKAIQKLQEKLSVQGIRLSVKPETRRKAEDLLIEKALNSFKDRARLVQQNMNAMKFSILELDLQTHGQAGAYQDDRMMVAQSSRSVESAPAIEGGTTTIRVQANGRIQLD